MRGLFFFVIFGLGVDSWRERAISEVRGLRDERGPTQLGIYTRTSTNTRHLLTICTQKATRFDKGSCRSRCCGQAGNSLSCSALSRTSLLDSRAKHGNDSIIFSSVILGQAQRVPGISGYSGHTLSVTLRLDVRGKPEHDRKKNKHGNDNIFFLCLTFNIVAFL